MNALAAVRQTRPYMADYIVERAARAASNSAASGKTYAKAMGISVSRASRHRAGDANSPIANILATICRLAEADKATAMGLIEEQEAIVIMIEVAALTNAELRKAEQEATDREHDEEARENRTTARLNLDTATPDELRAAADADRVEALTQRTRAEVRTEIARRMDFGSWN